MMRDATKLLRGLVGAWRFELQTSCAQDRLVAATSPVSVNQFYAERIGAGGATISTSPVATSYTRPDISQAPGNAVARSAATSTATAAQGSVIAFVLRSPSC